MKAMNMSTSRIALYCVLLFSGCFDAQPAPECNVFTANALLGTTAYWASMKQTSSTGGTCPALTGMEIGMARFAPPGTAEFTVALRPKRLVSMAMGELSDGTPRSDPNDREGKNITSKAALSQYPANGVCTVSGFTGPDGASATANSQHFEAVTLETPDGGQSMLPALLVKYDWSDFSLYMNAKTPGTVWTAKLAYTEGDCHASYDVLAFWPIVHCDVENAQGVIEADDSACNPEPDASKGQVVGSGINPAFKPKCDPKTFICTPTVSIAPLR